METSATPLVFAPAVAAATKRVRIGLSVSVLGLHHPALIAESAAMVDHLSNGRLDFGYGSGSQTIEYEGLGIPVEEARERTLEAFEIIRRLWTEDKVSHAGRFFTVDDVGTRPRPLQRPHPPVYLASQSPAAVEWVAEQGLGLLTSGIFSPLETTLESGARYAAARSRMGDSPEQAAAALQKNWVVALWVHVADTDEEAHANARGPQLWLRKVSDELRVPRDWSNLSDEFAARMREKMKHASPISDWDHLRDNVMAIGSPDTVLKKLQALADSGAGQMIAWMDFGGLDNEKVMHSMTLFRNDVVPRLQESAQRERVG